jgi:hypothetical protein
MKEHESHTGSNPTRLKVAVCADLLTKLCFALKQYAPVLLLGSFQFLVDRSHLDHGTACVGIVKWHFFRVWCTGRAIFS